MRRAWAVLVIFGVSLFFALATGFALLYQLLYVLALGLLLSFVWSWLNLRGLTVTADRRTPRTQVGKVAEERLTVRNTGPLGKSWLVVQDETELPGHHTATVISLPRGKFRSWRVATECRRRGRYTLGPVVVGSGDPFGLFWLERAFGETQSVLVYPATVELAHFALLPGDLPGESSSRRRALNITPNAYTVRDYVFGDSFNRIHWRSTARTGRLMVREFEEEPFSDLWIVLDLHGAAQTGHGEEGTEEYGVTVAASVAKLYLETNHSVGLIAYGDSKYLLSPQRGGQHLTRLLETLATVSARGTVPLYEVLASEESRFGKHTSVLVITPSASQEWTAGLRHLVQRKVRAAAVLLDSRSFGGQEDATALQGSLAAGGIPTYVVRQGDDLSKALGQVQAGANLASLLVARR